MKSSKSLSPAALNWRQKEKSRREMNVERLHKIISALKADLEQTNLIGVFGGLVSRIGELSSDPNNTTHQTNVADSKKALTDLLIDFPTNSYPTSWRHTIEDLNLNWFLASNLAGMIDQAFRGKELLPAAIHSELQEIQTTLEEDKNMADMLVQSLGAFGIGKEELSEGECDISVSFSPKTIDGDLKNFGEEVLNIEKLVVKPFSVLVTGSAQELRLKSISSSGFVVTFQLVTELLFDAAKTTAALATAVERVIAAYRAIKELQDSRSIFVGDEDAPDELLKELDSFVDGKIDNALNKIVDDLIAKFSKSKSKAKINLSKVALKKALEKIARWINKGSTIETRMERLAAPGSSDENEDERSEDTEELASFYKTIGDAHKVQIQFEAESEPLLQIENNDDDA